VAAQNRILLARAWDDSDVASADGLRFVVPVRTIHLGQRGAWILHETYQVFMVLPR
jgi:TnpA family transposase